MRFVAFLACLVVLSGCNSQLVKDDYMTLEKIKKSKKFMGYEIAIGPIALKGLTANEDENLKSEDDSIPFDAKYLVPDDWADKDELKFPGPMRITREVNAAIRMETKKLFHRRVKIDDKYYYFKIEEGAKGYGFKFVSVRNKQNELAVFILKTESLVPSWDDPKNRVGQGMDPNYKRPKRTKKKEEGKGSDKKATGEGSEKASDEKPSDEKSEDQ